MKHTKGQSMPDGTIQYYKDAMGRAMVSTDYDPTSSYAVGDYCIYDNVRYCCNTDIASGGETWNSAHWDVAKVDDDISEIKSSLSQLFKTKMITHNFTANAMANVAWNGWTECNDEVGYTPIGVLDFACNTSAIEVVNCTILNTNGGMTIKNTTNSSVTNLFLYTVLYQKNL